MFDVSEMGENRGSGSLFDLLNPTATERCPANNPSSPIGHQESARQQPGDPALEAGLDLPDIIRRAHQPLDQLCILANEEGGRERVKGSGDAPQVGADSVEACSNSCPQ